MKQEQEDIIGSKKGGGGSSFYEADNTLQSNAIVRILEAVSEGPIVGLVDGAKSIYLNNIPVENADGTKNFGGKVAWDQRVGMPSQPYMAGFPSASAEINVSVEVTTANPVTYTVSDITVTSMRVTVGLPQGLSFQDTENNRLVGSTVNLAIDRRLGSGAWSQVVQFPINGKTTNAFEEAYRIERPVGAGSWSIRVRRITPDSTQATLRQNTWLSRVTEIHDAPLEYADTAYIGLAVDAKSVGASQIPTRAFELYGLIVKVPANYDPVARTYTGQWNGTFKFAWTDNPAWVLYDLLCNPRYGLGKAGLSESDVDKYSFYNASVYNDQLVDNGKGGTEPRFRFNYVVGVRQDAARWLQDIAGVMNSKLIWIGGQVTVIQDRPASPVRLITRSNVVNGKFTYLSSSLSERITAVNVTWNDPENYYQAAVTTVEASQADIDRYGYNSIDIAALGATTEGQARRAGKWHLETVLNQLEVVKFQQFLNGADLFPGDIIKLYDEDYAGAQQSGRLLAGSTSTSIVLDRPVPLTAGSTIDLVKNDGTIETRTISQTSGSLSTVTVTQAFSWTPAEYESFIITTTLSPRQFRVTKVSLGEDLTVDFEAVEHDPSKYSRIESGVDVPAPVFSEVPAGVTSSVQNLLFKEVAVNEDNTIKRTLNVSWQRPTTGVPVGYLFKYQVDSGGWVSVETQAPQADIHNAQPGLYEVSVAAINFNGIVGPAVKGTYNLNVTGGSLSPLAAPTDLQEQLTGGVAGADYTSVATRVAAIDYSADVSATAVSTHSKAAIVLRGFTNGQLAEGGAGYNYFQQLKAANPNIKLGQYTILTQMFLNGQNPDHDPLSAKIESGGTDGKKWWVFAANTTTKTRADLAYAAYEVNQTNYVMPNAAGNRWPQECAIGFHNTKLKTPHDAGLLDFVFTDNVFVRPREDKQVPLGTNIAGDYNLDGSNDNITDATLGSAFRQGYADYWTKLKELMPGIEIAGNTDILANTWQSSVDTTELRNKLDYGMVEAIIGRSYSTDTYNYFSGVMSSYRSVQDNVTKGCLNLAYVDSANRPNYFRKARYATGITLLDNGYVMVWDEPNKFFSGTARTTGTWFNEWDVKLGTPTEGRKTAATNTGPFTGKGLWTRTYQNGIVIVNPTDNGGRWMQNVGTFTVQRTQSTGKVRVTWSNWTSSTPHGKVVGDKVALDEVWFCSSPVRTGTGNGTMSHPVIASAMAGKAPSETWTVTATSATTFSVVGSVSGTKSNAMVGSVYANGTIQFTITAGSTAFVVGDKFVFQASTDLNGFYTITGVGTSYVEFDKAGSDLTLNNPNGFVRFQTTVDLSGLGYYRILGTDDAHNDYDNGTSQNDGTAVTTLKLWQADSVILVNSTGGTGSASFYGQDLSIKFTNPLSNGAITSTSLRDFELRVIDTSTSLTLRTEYLPAVPAGAQQTYMYTYAANTQDGGPRRSMKIEVRCRDTNNNLSDAVAGQFTNPAPGIPSNITVFSGVGSNKILYNLPSDPDYRGVLVWRDLTGGFTPSAANLVYDTSDNYIADNSLTAGQIYYYKLAAYDTFGKSVDGVGLNVSSAYSGTPTGVGIANGATNPTTGSNGDLFFNTTDGKLYRRFNGAWTAAVPAVDVSGQLTGSQIAAAAVGTTQLANGSVTASKLVLTDSTNAYPDFDMLDASLYSTPDSATYGFNATAGANTGQRYVTITPNAALRRVVTGWFPVEVSAPYFVSAVAWLPTSTAGQGTVTLDIEFGSLAADTTITSTRTVQVLTRTDVFDISRAGVDVTTAATEKRARFVISRAGGGTGFANCGGLRVQRRANATLIVDGSVTAAKIAAETITADKIAANAITSSELAADSVTAGKILASAVTADKIAANAVTTDKLVANAVTADKIATAAVDATKIDSRNLTIKDAAGNVIFSSGGMAVVDGFRSTDPLPQDYTTGESYFFKNTSVYSLPSTGAISFGTLRTVRQYGIGSDLSGIPISQWFISNGLMWTRKSTSATTWGAWEPVLNGQITPSNASTFIQSAAINAAQIGSLNVGVMSTAISPQGSGGRVVISGNRIEVYDESNVLRVRIGQL